MPDWGGYQVNRLADAVEAIAETVKQQSERYCQHLDTADASFEASRLAHIENLKACVLSQQHTELAIELRNLEMERAKESIRQAKMPWGEQLREKTEDKKDDVDSDDSL